MIQRILEASRRSWRSVVLWFQAEHRRRILIARRSAQQKCPMFQLMYERIKIKSRGVLLFVIQVRTRTVGISAVIEGSSAYR